MIAGMSPHGFRDKAKQFLNIATESAEVAQKEAEMQVAQMAIDAYNNQINVNKILIIHHLNVDFNKITEIMNLYNKIL